MNKVMLTGHEIHFPKHFHGYLTLLKYRKVTKSLQAFQCLEYYSVRFWGTDLYGLN